jgi:uncharacterized lipoprotein YmbA
MNMIRSPRYLILALVVAAVPMFLIGCGTSPTPRFYTLQSVTFPEKTDYISFKNAKVAVGVGPVEIPDYLDQAQIVTRTDQNRLIVAEFDLWGGSLKTDVTRVLVENLSALLAGDGMSIFSWRAHVPNMHKLPVSLIRFDAAPGGKVSLKARWAVVGKDNINLGTMREAAIVKPVKGGQYSDVVAAMSEALEELSKEMAADIKTCLSQDKGMEGQ